MKIVHLTVSGADNIAKQLDDIEDLILKLRRKLADLGEMRLQLEAHLNQEPTSSEVDSMGPTESA